MTIEPVVNLAPANSPSPPRIAALIAAYNEDRFIGSVVLKARQYVDTVIVVDDGSTDRTAHVAETAGAVVLRHIRNMGKAAALNTALREARELSTEAVVLIDGDGQHDPADIPMLLRPILEGQADIVVGSRFLGRKSDIPGWRVAGQHTLTAVTNTLSGQSLTDSQSGFRAISRQALIDMHFSQTGFTVESEMQFLAKERNLRLTEVPVGVVYIERRKRNPVPQAAQVINGVLRLAGQSRPLLFFGIPGVIMLLAGSGLGWEVVAVYTVKKELAIGYALITVLLSILGTLSLFTGIMLHSIRGLFVQFADRRHRS